MGYIYKHTNKINGKVYIGQTTRNPQKRWLDGRGYINDKRKLTSPFANAIMKYGWNNFEHEIICEVDNEKLDELERYYISFYKSNIKEFGYNCESGGNKNKKLSKETREKLSKSHKGKAHPCSEETRKKLSVLRTGKGNPMYGVKGEKHPNFGKKRPMSSYVKEILRSYLIGHHCSEETKNKIKKSLIGHTISAESREKMSKSHLGKSIPQNYKAVVMLTLNGDFVKEFDSIKEVTFYLNSIGIKTKSLSHISGVCRGKRKQTYGYKWMYKEDYYGTNSRS